MTTNNTKEGTGRPVSLGGSKMNKNKRRITIDFSEEQFKQLWIEKGSDLSWFQFFWMTFILNRDKLSQQLCGSNNPKENLKRIKKNKQIYENVYGRFR